MIKYTEFDAESSKLSELPSLYVGGKLHIPRPGGAVVRPVVADKPGSLQAPGAIYTLEPERSSEAAETPLQKLKENRLRCLETANILQQMADYDFESPLHKAADRIRNCSLAGAFRSLSETVNHKVGQALCKNRLCPNCQAVLAARRRTAFMEWLDMNKKPLEGFKFYHMVLNVRHSVATKLRDGLYTEELVQFFRELRGLGGTCNRARKAWWDKRVSGGVYSVELAPGKTDVSAHIHIHITLFCAPGTIPIYRADRPSQFVKQATAIWRKLTKDPKAKNIFLEPVYYITEAGKKEYYQEGQPVELLYKAVAECMKYTLKSDESSLLGYTPAFLEELLTTPNRYYGRFGILTLKDKSPIIFCELERLNSNFQDLQQMVARELETLYNPETGEVHCKTETRIALSYFKNTRSKTAPMSVHSARGDIPRGGEQYYQFRDPFEVTYLPPNGTRAAALFLARTTRAEYLPGYDLADDYA
jgi:hypothetical protein